MKVMQLNMWMGHLLNPALKFIDQTNPDVLAAQEVISSEHGYPLYDYYQTHQKLRERFPYNYFSATYSFTALGESCDYGNAIYSKYPLQNKRTVFTVGDYRPNVSIQDLGASGEIRNLQIATVEAEGHAYTLANHHGYHNKESETDASVKSMHKAAEALKNVDPPLIFCGDFNAGPSSSTVHQLDHLGLVNLPVTNHLKTTLSSVHRFDFPLVTDFIMLSPQLRLKNFQALDVVVSDHLPLIADLN